MNHRHSRAIPFALILKESLLLEEPHPLTCCLIYSSAEGACSTFIHLLSSKRAYLWVYQIQSRVTPHAFLLKEGPLLECCAFTYMLTQYFIPHKEPPHLDQPLYPFIYHFTFSSLRRIYYCTGRESLSYYLTFSLSQGEPTLVWAAAIPILYHTISSSWSIHSHDGAASIQIFYQIFFSSWRIHSRTSRIHSYIVSHLLLKGGSLTKELYLFACVPISYPPQVGSTLAQVISIHIMYHIFFSSRRVHSRTSRIYSCVVPYLILLKEGPLSDEPLR